MRKFQPGALFKANGRRFVDSQALYNFTAAAHSSSTPRRLAGDQRSRSCRCNRVEGRRSCRSSAARSNEITPEAGAIMKPANRMVDAGLVQVPTGRRSLEACGRCVRLVRLRVRLGPCQEKHAHHHGGPR